MHYIVSISGGVASAVAADRAYCEQYGLNYSEARAQVMREMTAYERTRYPAAERSQGGLL